MFTNWTQDSSKLNPLITLLAVVVGYLGIRHQIFQNHQNTLKQNRESKRQDIYLRLYELLELRVMDATDKVIKTGNQALLLPINLDTRRRTKEDSNIDIGHSGYNSYNLSELNGQAVQSIINAGFVLENYEIALGRLKGIHETLMNRCKELTELHRKFVDSVQRFIPPTYMDNLPKDYLNNAYPVPGQDALKTIKKTANSYHELTVTVMAELKDLIGAAQRVLLGGLFDGEVPLRQPLDPSFEVLKEAD